jgi:hypothetical protein
MKNFVGSPLPCTASRPGTLALLAAGFMLLAGARLMPRFVQDLTAGDPLNQVFYTTVSFFGVSIDVPRPTQEARAELQKYVALPPSQRPQSATPQGAAPPGDAEARLYRLLAEQDERVLDFAAAEANLQRFVERSSDKPAAYGVLADFYEQRLRFGDAVAALVREAEVADRRQAKLRSQGGCVIGRCSGRLGSLNRGGCRRRML